jgi:hypothetical protein
LFLKFFQLVFFLNMVANLSPLNCPLLQRGNSVDASK